MRVPNRLGNRQEIPGIKGYGRAIAGGLVDGRGCSAALADVQGLRQGADAEVVPLLCAASEVALTAMAINALKRMDSTTGVAQWKTWFAILGALPEAPFAFGGALMPPPPDLSSSA